jgi:large subunit ribosomal protein L34e
MSLINIRKLSNKPKCTETGELLNGLDRITVFEKKNVCKNKKSVNRPYGGQLCMKAVRERILRSFIVHELKIQNEESR